jgi:putative transposase
VPDYRRAFAPGGTFFFTLVTENRQPLFAHEQNRAILRQAIIATQTTRPFILVAIALLHEHLHLILTLPDNDADFSMRLASIKAQFTRGYLDAGGAEQQRTDSRVAHRNRGVWQRRFWEHTIRDPDDLQNHVDYTHFNPVKHGLVTCPHAWPHSSFHRHVDQNLYDRNWQCACGGAHPIPPDFRVLAGVEMDL